MNNSIYPNQKTILERVEGMLAEMEMKKRQQVLLRNDTDFVNNRYYRLFEVTNLIMLIGERKHIILNQSLSTTQKNFQWNIITDLYNRVASHARTPKQLKSKWEYLKKVAKKEYLVRRLSPVSLEVLKLILPIPRVQSNLTQGNPFQLQQIENHEDATIGNLLDVEEVQEEDVPEFIENLTGNIAIPDPIQTENSVVPNNRNSVDPPNTENSVDPPRTETSTAQTEQGNFVDTKITENSEIEITNNDIEEKVKIESILVEEIGTKESAKDVKKENEDDDVIIIEDPKSTTNRKRKFESLQATVVINLDDYEDTKAKNESNKSTEEKESKDEQPIELAEADSSDLLTKKLKPNEMSLVSLQREILLERKRREQEKHRYEIENLQLDIELKKAQLKNTNK